MMSSKTVPRWRFLGDVSIPGPDGDLTPHLGKKPIALLAYLALAREGAGRDELAALLWPDHDPSRSKHNLRQCLLSLRQAFGDGMDGVLEVSDDWLALNHERSRPMRGGWPRSMPAGWRRRRNCSISAVARSCAA